MQYSSMNSDKMKPNGKLLYALLFFILHLFVFAINFDRVLLQIKMFYVLRWTMCTNGVPNYEISLRKANTRWTIHQNASMFVFFFIMFCLNSLPCLVLKPKNGKTSISRTIHFSAFRKPIHSHLFAIHISFISAFRPISIR